MVHTQFGKDENGEPYTIEKGANWIQGLRACDEGCPVNPILNFAEQVELNNTYSNFDSIISYDWTGENNFTDIIDELDGYWEIFEQDAGTILSGNQQDRSIRAGMWQSGWRPGQDAHRKAVEWWLWDFETSSTPEESSFVSKGTGVHYVCGTIADSA